MKKCQSIRDHRIVALASGQNETQERITVFGYAPVEYKGKGLTETQRLF